MQHPLARNYINTFIWKPSLKRAGVPATRENGSHALRHFYASTALHEGESIKALSEYLGHADPASPCAPTPTWSRTVPSARSARSTRCSATRQRRTYPDDDVQLDDEESTDAADDEEDEEGNHDA